MSTILVQILSIPEKPTRNLSGDSNLDFPWESRGGGHRQMMLSGIRITAESVYMVTLLMRNRATLGHYIRTIQGPMTIRGGGGCIL